jgi:hypothetical protein
MRNKLGIRKLIGVSKKINYFKNLWKYKNFNGEKFHLTLNKEPKICVTVGTVEYLWAPRTEIGPKNNKRTLLN